MAARLIGTVTHSFPAGLGLNCPSCTGHTVDKRKCKSDRVGAWATKGTGSAAVVLAKQQIDYQGRGGRRASAPTRHLPTQLVAATTTHDSANSSTHVDTRWNSLSVLRRAMERLENFGRKIVSGRVWRRDVHRRDLRNLAKRDYNGNIRPSLRQVMPE